MQIKIYKFLKKNLTLKVIVIAGFLLRVVALDEVPPSLNWDEISHGYNAYSILHSAKDEWGNFLPIIFRAYGDYKLPLYIYLTSLSELIFGINAHSVRLVSVIAGTFTIYFTYFITKKLFSPSTLNLQPTIHKLIAPLAALLVTIEPWSFFLSRGAFEANLAMSFFAAGMYFYLFGLEKPKSLIVSAVFFGFTVWTYNSYRIFTPLMIIALITIYKSRLLLMYKRTKTNILIPLITMLVFLLPMFYQLTNTQGQARYFKVAIIDEGAVNKINEMRNSRELPVFVERVIYNKGTFFIQTIAVNWASHFSTAFLFTEGGSQYQYSLQGHGLLYKMNAIFLVVGFVFVGYLIAKKSKSGNVLLLWIVLAPLPASITRDSPHALRAVTVLPALMIVTALGVAVSLVCISKIFKNIKSKTLSQYFVAAYLIVLFFFIKNFLNIYFNEYKREFSWSWQYGYEEVVDYVNDNYSDYDKIIVTKKYGEPHEFFLFYGAMNNSEWTKSPDDFYEDENLVRFSKSGWYWIDRFDKFYFVNNWDIPVESDKDFKLESGEVFDCDFSRCLLITEPGNYQRDWKLKKEVYFLDGNNAFDILDNT